MTPEQLSTAYSYWPVCLYLAVWCVGIAMTAVFVTVTFLVVVSALLIRLWSVLGSLIGVFHSLRDTSAGRYF